jgi:hypothetical protein
MEKTYLGGSRGRVRIEKETADLSTPSKALVCRSSARHG